MAINKQPECEEVGLWLQGSIGYEQPNLISRLRKHAVSCSRCRGMLFLTHFELMGRPQPQHRFISCDVCQQDLAAYIDIMQDQGEWAAAQTYPHVWWHLWTCEECIEIFEDTLTLVQRFRFEPFIHLKPIINAVTFQQNTPLTSKSFTLSRDLFAPFFGHLVQHRTSRGRSEEHAEYIWHEHEEFADCVISFLVAHIREEACDLQVIAKPTTCGRVQIDLGIHHFSAALDQEGKANFKDIPMSLLSDPNGPDLQCYLELEALD